MASTSAMDYRQMLLDLLELEDTTDPLYQGTIAELEASVLDIGKSLPIVRLPMHYHRSNETLPNKIGEYPFCACGERWPHETSH